MARIENHKYSIEEAFRECFYIVPDYQREYVWTDKEVHQLLEDIGEQIDAGTTREYFIGTVLVSLARRRQKPSSSGSSTCGGRHRSAQANWPRCCSPPAMRSRTCRDTSPLNLCGRGRRRPSFPPGEPSRHYCKSSARRSRPCSSPASWPTTSRPS